MRRLGCAAFLWILAALSAQPAHAQATAHVRIVVAPSSRLGFAHAPAPQAFEGAALADSAPIPDAAPVTSLDAGAAAAMIEAEPIEWSGGESAEARMERSATAPSRSLCAPAARPRWAEATRSAARLTVSRRPARTSEPRASRPAAATVVCTLVAP